MHEAEEVSEVHEVEEVSEVRLVLEIDDELDEVGERMSDEELVEDCEVCQADE